MELKKTSKLEARPAALSENALKTGQQEKGVVALNSSMEKNENGQKTAAENGKKSSGKNEGEKEAGMLKIPPKIVPTPTSPSTTSSSWSTGYIGAWLDYLSPGGLLGALPSLSSLPDVTQLWRSGPPSLPGKNPTVKEGGDDEKSAAAEGIVHYEEERWSCLKALKFEFGSLKA